MFSRNDGVQIIRNMENQQLEFFAGTGIEPSPIDPPTAKLNNPPVAPQRKTSARPPKREPPAENNEGKSKGAKGNWKKVFAFSKFMSLAKSQSDEGPAQLIIAGRYSTGFTRILMFIFPYYLVQRDIVLMAKCSDFY